MAPFCKLIYRTTLKHFVSWCHPLWNIIINLSWDVCMLVQGNDQCDACKHVQDGAFCKAECPESSYTDDTQTCRPCHSNCLVGCTGPANTLGHGGCNACDVVVYTEPGSSYCLAPNSPCPLNFFPRLSKDNWSRSRYVVSSVLYDISCVTSRRHRMHLLGTTRNLS